MQKPSRWIILFLLFTAQINAAETGLKLPEGFEITEFAGSDLANDIYTMTIDDRGRIYVAGRGYIRQLVDTNGDGKADKAVQFSDGPKDGAMGLLWEGRTLYFTGDGGLRRYHDKNDDGKADGPSELIRKLKTGGEHTAHAIRRGPDGWLYVLCGNHAGVNASYAQTEGSPIRKPIAGVVLRFSPDLKKSEIYADGFRNPYGMDFNSKGDLFAYDSDNERCVSLPWYEPTRFYHVTAGGHHGWRSPQAGNFWRFPPYFVDVVAPLVTCERGSPTGVACYRHVQFPEKYRDGFFLLDWTFGIVYFVKVTPSGASYKATRETFLEAKGDNGFAPTGVAVDPTTGDLYVSIGGRGTRGAVYRIRYKAGLERAKKEPGLTRFAKPIEERYSKSDLGTLAWKGGGDAPYQIVRYFEQHYKEYNITLVWRTIQFNAKWEDRLLCQIAARLLSKIDYERYAKHVPDPEYSIHKSTVALGIVKKHPAEAVKLALSALNDRESNKVARLAAVRVMQLAMGDLGARRSFGTVLEGYSAREKISPAMAKQIEPAIERLFPTGKHDLDMELARTLSMIQSEKPSAVKKVLSKLTATSHPVDDLHYLIVLSQLQAKRSEEQTKKTAEAMLAIDKKIHARKLNRDRHWPQRVVELHRELVKRDPKLNDAILTNPDFGRADHVVWTEARGIDRTKAAERFFAKATKASTYDWNAQVLRLLGTLPAEKINPLLRKLWGEVGLDSTILSMLARKPEEQDREKFLQGLQRAQLNEAKTAFNALKKLKPKKDPETLLSILQAIQRLPTGKPEDQHRQHLMSYLADLTGVKHDNRDAWLTWFKMTYPKHADQLTIGGVDLEAWKKRLLGVDWDKGNAERGFNVYRKTTCMSCHSGARALGPDLKGVTGRFSRDDLFTAIVQPDKDVSSRYRTVSIETEQGKFYQGMIIYAAVDSVIVQTGAATTVRLDAKNITSQRVMARSLMPTGLLDKLRDDELADLYAYLRSLGK